MTLDALGVVYSVRAARHRARVTWRLSAAGRALSVLTTLCFTVPAVNASAAAWWTGVISGLRMFLCLAGSVPAAVRG